MSPGAGVAEQHLRTKESASDMAEDLIDISLSLPLAGDRRTWSNSIRDCCKSAGS